MLVNLKLKLLCISFANDLTPQSSSVRLKGKYLYIDASLENGQVAGWAGNRIDIDRNSPSPFTSDLVGTEEEVED